MLAADTSTAIGSVALLDDGEVRAELAARVSAKHGETLLPNIARVLEEAGVTIADVELLAVGLGPGSFTGLRIALATMKGLALARSVPLVGVGSLLVLARGVDLEGRVVVSLLDAHKQEVFCAAYGLDAANEVIEFLSPAHALPASASALLLAALDGETRPLALVGDALGALRDPIATALERAGHVLLPPPDGAEFPRAAALAVEAERRFHKRGGDDLRALEPLYVRAPDITMPAPCAVDSPLARS